MDEIASLPGVQAYWTWIVVWLVATVLLIGAGIFLRRRIAQRLPSAPRSLAFLLGLALTVTGLSMLATPTGDEPHYLIMSESLVQDGDFDLRNNYARMDYLAYYPGPLSDSHVIVIGERWYPVHGVGLSVLVAPAFAIAGRLGVVLLLATMSAAGIGLTWFALRAAGFTAIGASVAALAATLTLPLASMAGQIYPEVPAFLLVALSMYAILAPGQRRWRVAALALSVVILPWLHAKYAILAAALLCAALVVHRRSWLSGAALGFAALVASGAALAALFYSWFGVLLPPNIMPRTPGNEDWLGNLLAHFSVEPLVGLAGVLFDQQAGLFLASPVQVLVIPGLLLLWRRAPRLALAAGLVLLSVYLPAGMWGVWHAEGSSPARFMLPIVPLLAFGIAAVVELGGRVGRAAFVVLAVPSFIHAYLMVTLPSFTRYGYPETYYNYFLGLVQRFTQLDLRPLFPTFRQVDGLTWITLLGYLLAVALLTIILLRRARRADRQAQRGGTT